MFDLNKLADMSKIAQEAKAVQQRQENMQKEQLEILKKISQQLDVLIEVVKKSR